MAARPIRVLLELEAEVERTGGVDWIDRLLVPRRDLTDEEIRTFLDERVYQWHFSLAMRWYITLGEMVRTANFGRTTWNERLARTARISLENYLASTWVRYALGQLESNPKAVLQMPLLLDGEPRPPWGAPGVFGMIETYLQQMITQSSPSHILQGADEVSYRLRNKSRMQPGLPQWCLERVRQWRSKNRGSE